jgi:hypothetical protein
MTGRLLVPSFGGRRALADQGESDRVRMSAWPQSGASGLSLRARCRRTCFIRKARDKIFRAEVSLKGH